MSEKPKKPTLLYGEIKLDLSSAKNLPATGSIHGVFKKQTTDPYCAVVIGDNRIIRSSVVEDNRSPKWHEEFTVPVCCAEVYLTLQVVDKDVKTGDTLGKVTISCKELVKEETISGWQTLTDDNDEELDSYIKFSISYVGIADQSADFPVENSYYPVRKLGNVTLYQDAHPVSDHFDQESLPSCTEDIYNAIFTSKKFVYISGRVNPYMKLARTQKRCMELGRLLIRRAKSGVNVLILLWDEDSKLQNIPSCEGAAGCYSSNETREYFSGTGVKAALVSRNKEKPGYLKDQVPKTCYDHNQRCIILDSPDYSPSSNKRCITAFLGGLDLCAGQWDTPEHELYSSLEAEHKHDFYQPSYQTDQETGPRLPQHSIHCKVEGRGAYDVLKNFEERWKKQASRSKQSYLTKVNSSKFILRGGSAKHNTWNVQLFRSINQDSAAFNKEENLTLDKGRLVDNGLHRALIHHIRRSKKFLYIETEQFMGRCWKGTQPRGHHLVALEIVSKICESVFSNTRYAVYIVLPLHPPGDPTSSEIQEIIYWQTQTMDMMYKMVAKAIAKKGPEGARVTDYLNFYTLGARVFEQMGPNLAPDDFAKAPSVARNYRGMINVNSCLLIVDDEYILVGGGAVSQRALSGKRNTELAVGAWQPKHTQDSTVDKPHPSGKVHQFRMLLWVEHTGLNNPTFRRPHRIGCVKNINKIANDNWKMYVSSDPAAVTKSNLMKFPIAIQSSGQVVTRKDAKFLPDTSALTLGRRQRFPSEKLTS